MNKTDFPEYRVWYGMKTRCYNPKDKGFSNYGGIGIKVCERWRTSFETFLEDMGERPSATCQIHRVDSDGDYSPKNCVWIEKSEHVKQKKRPHMIRRITDRQQEILDFIYKEISPSYREIGSAFSMSAKGAFDHVKALEKKGILTTDPRKSRSIRIIEPEPQQ